MTSSNSYFHVMRWLTLLMTLPPTPTRHRVGVWRKLQRMGAVRLRGAGWLLPETPETTELFQWLVQEIQSFRGEATLLRVDRVETMTDAEIATLFHKARGVEYQAVTQGCRDILRHLDRYQANHRRAIPQLRAKLDGLKRELDRIQSIDYLKAPAEEREIGRASCRERVERWGVAGGEEKIRRDGKNRVDA